MGGRIRQACLLGAASMIAVAGCGEKEEPAPAAGGISVQDPQGPDARTCAAGALKTGVKASEAPPPAGDFKYRVKGTRQVLGPDGFSKPLPAISTYIVTNAEPFGNIECFVVQRRFTSAMADTGVFAIRGSDVYLTDLESQNGGELISVTPSPPVLSVSGSDTEWSGEFSGATSASYRGEIVGRRWILVGGDKERAVGIRSEIAFAGDLTGTERSVRWFSLKDNLILAETVRQQRTFGLDKVRLEYSARLKSRHN